MLSRLLVPLDGSALAERALTWATALAKRTRGELLLLRVVPPTPAPVSAGEIPRLERKLIEAAQRYLDQCASRITGVQVRTRVALGDPASVIVATAEEERHDLVVMGTHGRDDLQRWLLGSVADRVVRSVTGPVLLITPGASDPLPALLAGARAPGRLLVPLDGSPLAESILPVAGELATALDAELLLLRVTPPLADVAPLVPVPDFYVGVDLVAVQAEIEREETDYLEGVAERLRAKGQRVSTLRRTGAPAETIVAVAEQEGALLIAMSTHGRSGIGRWALGSVASRVLHTTGVPLLLRRATPVGPPPTTPTATEERALA